MSNRRPRRVAAGRPSGFLGAAARAELLDLHAAERRRDLGPSSWRVPPAGSAASPPSIWASSGTGRSSSIANDAAALGADGTDRGARGPVDRGGGRRRPCATGRVDAVLSDGRSSGSTTSIGRSLALVQTSAHQAAVDQGVRGAPMCPRRSATLASHAPPPVAGPAAAATRPAEERRRRVHRRAAALRAAVRLRRVGRHRRDRGEVLARGRDAAVGDPAPAAAGGQDHRDRRARARPAGVRSRRSRSRSRSRPARSTCRPRRSARRCSSSRWFVLGFAFYASLFAAAGSLVTPDGGAAERDRADQPDDLGVVHHLDRRAAGPELDAVDRGVDPAGERGARRCRCASCSARPRRRRSRLSLALLIGSAIVLVAGRARACTRARCCGRARG